MGEAEAVVASRVVAVGRVLARGTAVKTPKAMVPAPPHAVQVVMAPVRTRMAVLAFPPVTPWMWRPGGSTRFPIWIFSSQGRSPLA
jgi:hypothetical protein